MELDTNAALILIDLQKGTVAAAPPGKAEVVARASQLARAFRERGLPVVLVNVAGRAPGRTDAGPPKISFPPDWTDLVSDLDPQPSDYLVTKHRFSAFIGTQLNAYLRQHGVTQIVLAGISTSIGVESTAAAPSTSATTLPSSQTQ